MKLSLFTISSLLLAPSVTAFVQKTAFSPPTILSAVELEPEPEGGEEITSVKTIEGSRMKNMGEVEGVSNDDGTVYKFWLSAFARAPLIKQLNTEVMKNAKKDANFPGFRKGQVPPYALPQIRGFAVQEGIIQTVQSAVTAYGLKSISGSDGEVEVKENIPEIAQGYQMGDDIEFTATFNAIFDPELKTEETPADEKIVDVEVEEV